MSLESFNISELGIFVGVVSSACIGMIVASQKSKCTSVCFGMCKRDVGAVVKSEKLKLTGSTGDTPKGKMDLVLKEPEPEPKPKVKSKP